MQDAKDDQGVDLSSAHQVLCGSESSSHFCQEGLKAVLLMLSALVRIADHKKLCGCAILAQEKGGYPPLQGAEPSQEPHQLENCPKIQT